MKDGGTGRRVTVPADARIPTGNRTDDGGLRRAITPTLLLVFIVGDILGGGIYALVGEVGAETGGAIWSAFMLALLMAAFTAGSYGELVSKYRHSGGAALCVHRAFGFRSPPGADCRDRPRARHRAGQLPRHLRVGEAQPGHSSSSRTRASSPPCSRGRRSPSTP